MRSLVAKLKPTVGLAQAFHISLIAILPLILYILVRVVRVDFFQLALAIILLSKWRMFAVRPRYWSANIRANGVDLVVGISTVIFMSQTTSSLWQLLWAVLYGAWLIGLKPMSNVLGVSMQALIGQFVGLLALFLKWPSAPLYWLVLGAGVICYVAARHFFDSFEENYSKLLAYIWGYFGAALTWLLGHWLLFYGVLGQPALLLTVIGYGLAALYYLDHYDRLTKVLKSQFIVVMTVVVALILVFSHWGNKII